MSLNIESVKHVNPRFKMIVSGFIRSVQSSLPCEETSFYIIPELIHIAILLFYYGEYFTIADKHIAIDSYDPGIISFDSGDGGSLSTGYGNIDVTNEGQKKNIWDFRCAKVNPMTTNSSGSLFIGIDGSGMHELNGSLTCSKKYYAFQSYYYPLRTILDMIHLTNYLTKMMK